MVFERALVGKRILKNVYIEFEGIYIKWVEVVDFKPTVLGIAIPSFVDTHAHYIAYSLSLTRPRLDGIDNIYDALEFIKENVPNVKKDVVIMEGFDDSKWERTITREDLDRITDRPLILRRVCGHKAVLNSSAIRLLKERFGNIPNLNEETGLAVEDLPLSLSKYFPPTDEEVENAILKAEELLRGLGIISVGENTSARYIKKLVEMDKRGELKVKWRVAAYFRQLEEIKDLLYYESDNFRIVGLKEFLDGSVGAKTAAFSKGYTDGSNGKLLKSDEELEYMLKTAENLSLGVWWHAIGDLAIDQALRVLQKSKNPENHRIEHFEFPRDEHYKIAANMGVKLSLQPNFVKRWGHLNGLYHKSLGDVFFWGNRFKYLENLGANYAFGSDTMPPGPIYGLLGALYHPLKEERLSLEEALYRYTTAGAKMLNDNDYGEIKTGKKAYITVITEECLKDLSLL
ncbi:MAG: amidohydrolase family protein [candidate division WOR-3 bacterium]